MNFLTIKTSFKIRIQAKTKSFFLSIVLLVFCLHSSYAQNDTIVSRHRIAIFAPLYLDSAFIGDTVYRYGKNVFPKFINPGLEFYEGAQLAIDSLEAEKVPLELFIYDTRSTKTTLSDQLNDPILDSVDMIITHCSGNELQLFADAGFRRNIPVINANLPNDGGVTGNPFFVILNSTLKTQCEGIYKHIQKYYALNKLIVFRKKGQLEDRIKSYFDDFGKNTASVSLKLKYIDLIDSFTIDQLQQELDSNTQTLCISGSLDENFGRRLTSQLASLRPSYQVSVMGMPTWDVIKDFSKPEYKGIEITYGTPFYNSKVDKVSNSISSLF